ncbi:GtrA family protein [Pontibacter sp. G13]|uniref:GtrA family protein n=1 Tax=Pontibacter sp. G13 TaxID=3074898 RepID=UPI00288A8DE3|nr:GtrA family protein [Pontibacter sp. G13]WNJ17077.1 GtrA family protein [Pontibacter sp. G13]
MSQTPSSLISQVVEYFESFIPKRFHVHLQLLKFGGVGVLCFIIMMAMLAVFKEWMGMTPQWANAISSFLIIWINYWLSREIVFGKGTHKTQKEAGLFFLFAGISYLINLVLYDWYLDIFHFLHYQIVKILEVLTLAIFNFITRKFLVFRKKMEPATQS